MSTTWASKISWIRSPTRSYIACVSSFSARPRWTSLISASSALRCRVSSNSRAFSSATLRLPASVVSRRDIGVAERVLVVEVLQRDPARRLAAHDERARTRTDLAISPEPIARAARIAAACSATPSLTRSGSRVSSTCLLKPIASDLLLVREADAALDRVREVEQARLAIEHADVDDLGVEDLLEPVADEVVHRLHLEVLREAALDVVDQRELGVALTGLLDRTRAAERGADVVRDEGEELLVLLGVDDVLAVALDDDRADGPVVVAERGAEPARPKGSRRTSTSPRSTMSRHWAVVTNIGVPRFRSKAVNPSVSPVPIGSQTLGSGKSSSATSTTKGQFIACRSSSYSAM